ncbi:MAG: TetR/AcrR family transcriptional regulator [Pleurocapsa minor GSE-CHR-MK-17-07R]|jgi:AcrR family transcriptional regulator|nr:TetR/AcrR family transcriptional regulator [Pleurocapsa minor GSE-CHR-MK 17-07R]
MTTQNKSKDKYQAILDASIENFARHGFWNTPTAQIARTARIADGTLFTYFRTKDDLIIEVYLTLKRAVAAYVMADFDQQPSMRDRLAHIWHRFIEWGLNQPSHFIVLQQITTSYALPDEVRAQGNEPFDAVNALALASIATGHIRNLPVDYVAAVMNSMSAATVQHIQAAQGDPAVDYPAIGFEMFWRSIST